MLDRRDTSFLLTTMRGSQYMHYGQTLQVGVEGFFANIVEGGRGANREA